jgi:hypothetical protein
VPTHANPDLLIVNDQVINPYTLAQITGAAYAPYLEFSSYKILKKVASRKKIHLSSDRLWLSVYFKQEVLNRSLSKVSLKWINDKIGWGVFAEKDFEAMEFIAEYTGVVLPRGKNDSKNAYCFEYLLDPDSETPYLIDAQEQGGISRYINHHFMPNLNSAFTIIDEMPHIILYTAKSIAKGEQLCYNYGADYWKKRSAPL